jgi:hypothetical protein
MNELGKDINLLCTVKTHDAFNNTAEEALNNPNLMLLAVKRFLRAYCLTLIATAAPRLTV